MTTLFIVIIKFLSSVILGTIFLLEYIRLSKNEEMNPRKNIFLSVLVILAFSLCFSNAFLYLMIILMLIFI